MAFLLFVDGGGDFRHSPYQVLTGIAVEDRRTEDLLRAIRDTVPIHFGLPLGKRGGASLRGGKLLNRRMLRLAAQLPPLLPEERHELVFACLLFPFRRILDDRVRPTRRQLTALAQAKLGFAASVLDLCAAHGVHVFAAVMTTTMNAWGKNPWRGASAILDRFAAFLEEQPSEPQGLLIVDERDGWRMGGFGSRPRLLPGPLLARGEPATLVGVANLVGYVIAHGLRILPNMTRPCRGELYVYSEAVLALEHRLAYESPWPQDFVTLGADPACRGT